MTEREARVVQPAHQETQQEVQQVQNVAGITYLAEGEGIPILFLHGVAGAARQFGPQLAAFGRTQRALAWDMPGHGHSAPLPLVTMDAMAASLGAFIAALGLDRPILVGHSLGGMIVQRLLVEAPHIARAVVLSQTSSAFGGRDPAWADSFIRERLGPLDEGRTMSDLAARLARSQMAPAAPPSAVVLAEDCIAHTPDSTYRDTILAMRGFDLRSALPHIAIPTLVIAGSLDQAAPATTLHRMADQIPGARCVVLEGVGHFAHLEAPDRFNQAINDFIAS